MTYGRQNGLRRNLTAVRHHPLFALGYLTIVGYGAWFYGFGVLLDDIVNRTGWDERLVVGVASISSLVAGAGALAAGRALDRFGSRRIFALGIVGSLLLVVAAKAPTLAAFGLVAVIGGGLVGATGQYHMTLSTAAGLHPHRAARAIAIVTLYGAFSSTLMLPLGGLLTDRFGWRTALVIYGFLATSGFVWAALVANSQPVHSEERSPLPWKPLVVVAIVSNFLGAAGFGTIGVYQVPLMVSLGLTLPLASSLAGLRGVAQFLGRLPIDPLVARLGSRRALAGANALIGIGAILLLWSGRPGFALAFALVAGIGIGAFSPLGGIFAYEVAGSQRVGTLMGLQAAAAGLGIATGPYVAASVAASAGDRRYVIPVAVVALVAASLTLVVGRRWEEEG